MSEQENQTGPGLEPYVPLEGVAIGNYANHPAYKPAAISKEDELRAWLTPSAISERIVLCHAAAWNAGWWHDIRTGNPLNRNNGELLMLMVSEVCEAAHGLDYGLRDDKLPHRMMVEVEIADFLIRLYDACGAWRIDLHREVEAYHSRGDRSHLPLPGRPALFHVVRHLSDAMEGDRKSDTTRRTLGLVKAHQCAIWYALGQHYDPHQAMIEKVEYNRTRADHQRAARLAPGGKAY